MRSRHINAIFAVLTAVLIVILGSGSTLAQGRGHGGGGGGGGGQQRQIMMPAPQRQQQPQIRQQAPPQIRQQMPQMRQQTPQIRVQREQPRIQQQPRIQRNSPGYIGPPVPINPKKGKGGEAQVWQNPGRGRIDQPRIQPQIDRRRDVFSAGRQNQPDRTLSPDRSIRGGARGNLGNIGDNGRGSENAILRQDQRNDRFNQNQNGRGQGPPAWSHAWPNNYGYERSTQVHERNDLRRASRNDARVAQWFTNRYADVSDRRWNRQAIENQELWRENMLRNVVVNTLVTNPGYGYYNNYYPTNAYYPVYSPVYYDPYYSPFYTSYAPAYYDSFYDPFYDPFYTAYSPAYYDPYYSSYYPAYSFGMPYDPAYYSTYYYNDYPVPYYYGGPTFSISFTSGLGGNAFYSDPYYYGLPYDVVANPYYGDIYPRRSYSELVAYGYDQGYRDGLAARRAGYGTRHYYDPYTYDQTVYSDVAYDPYSYSLGENRRCLSKGYELGYMDALYGGRRYDPYNNGNVDLVSAFVSNTSIVL